MNFELSVFSFKELNLMRPRSPILLVGMAAVIFAISSAMLSGSPTSGYVPWPAAKRPRMVRRASAGNDCACMPCSRIKLSTASQSACSSE